MTITDSIKKDHDDFRTMISKLQKTTIDDREVRLETFSTLRRTVFAHFIAEEITVFKDMLKVTELRPLVLELIEEHRVIRNQIDVLDGTSFNDEIWLPRLALISEMFALHLDKEESIVTSVSPKYFSEAQIEALGQVFISSEAEEMSKMIIEG
jgi:hypothetical protein